MGGWMPYERVRRRNGISWHPEQGITYPYPGGDVVSLDCRPGLHGLVGDLNRMENGYLVPELPGVGCGATLDHSPLHETARATGVDVETVRAVLTYVFTGLGR